MGRLCKEGCEKGGSGQQEEGEGFRQEEVERDKSWGGSAVELASSLYTASNEEEYV